jgi:6,7-dimethyl-8-ribityllumazine synthase
MVNRIEARRDGSSLRIAVLDTEWNDFIVSRLTAGAIASLTKLGVADDHIDHVTVPGAFELPVAAKALADSGRYDAIVALGCVIRGATPHFDYVAGGAASGLARVQEATGIPVAFGVLTTDTIEQAIERAGTKAGNKGAEAAGVAVEMAGLLKSIGGADR